MFKNQCIAWNSGVISSFTDKTVEDNFLYQCSLEYKVNCKKNPGKMAECIVFDSLIELKTVTGLKKDAKLDCDWLGKKKYTKPDIVSDNYIFEVKSLRFYNGKGRKGCQGTAPEKIDSVFTKYSNIRPVYDKKVIVVICGALQYDEHVKMFLDVYEGKRCNNRNINMLYENYRNDIVFVRFQNLESYLGGPLRRRRLSIDSTTSTISENSIIERTSCPYICGDNICGMISANGDLYCDRHKDYDPLECDSVRSDCATEDEDEIVLVF